MKPFARRETTTERVVVPSLLERIEEIETELKAEWEKFIDNHKYDGVPRSSSERWAWGEVNKLYGGRLQLYSRVARWIAEN